VTVNADGVIAEEFDTLVNPMRDMGATWIHGIATALGVSRRTAYQRFGRVQR
jgi:hypothetical protein